jgi:hypothetical protein
MSKASSSSSSANPLCRLHKIKPDMSRRRRRRRRMYAHMYAPDRDHMDWQEP